MSDMATSAFNALCTFEEGVVWIWCNWHVLGAIRDNMGKLSGSLQYRDDLRIFIKKHFGLAQLAESEEICQNNIAVIRSVLEMEEQDNMLNYLEKNWFHHDTIPHWAFWARAKKECCGTRFGVERVNMLLESWHRVLKYVTMEGKKNTKIGIFFGMLQDERKRSRAKSYKLRSGVVPMQPRHWDISFGSVTCTMPEAKSLHTNRFVIVFNSVLTVVNLKIIVQREDRLHLMKNKD